MHYISGWAGVAAGLLVTTLLMTGPVFAQSADASTTIILDWIEVFDRSSPNPRSGIISNKTMTVVLTGGNRISQSYNTRSGKYTKGNTAELQLGSGWQVAAENVLTHRLDYPNHVRVITVRVNDRACSLAVTHELKSGQSVYRYPMISQPGRIGTYSRIATQSASCSIK